MILELSIFGAGCLLAYGLTRFVKHAYTRRYRAGMWLCTTFVVSVLTPLFAYEWAPRLGLS